MAEKKIKHEEKMRADAEEEAREKVRQSVRSTIGANQQIDEKYLKEKNSGQNFAYAVNFGSHIYAPEAADKMRRRMPPFRNFDFT